MNHDRCENLRSKMPDDLKNRQNVEIIFENLRLYFDKVNKLTTLIQKKMVEIKYFVTFSINFADILCTKNL